MDELRRDRDARRPGEVERDEAGDVGDGEAIARNERPIAEDAVKDPQIAQRGGGWPPPSRRPEAPPSSPYAGGCGERPGRLAAASTTRRGAATSRPSPARAASRR